MSAALGAVVRGRPMDTPDAVFVCNPTGLFFFHAGISRHCTAALLIPYLAEVVADGEIGIQLCRSCCHDHATTRNNSRIVPQHLVLVELASFTD